MKRDAEGMKCGRDRPDRGHAFRGQRSKDVQLGEICTRRVDVTAIPATLL